MEMNCTGYPRVINFERKLSLFPRRYMAHKYFQRSEDPHSCAKIDHVSIGSCRTRFKFNLPTSYPRGCTFEMRTYYAAGRRGRSTSTWTILSKFLLTSPLSFVEVIDCAIHRHPFVAGVFQHKQSLQEASSSLLDSRHGWCWKKVPILGKPDSPMEWIFSDRQTNQQTLTDLGPYVLVGP